MLLGDCVFYRGISLPPKFFPVPNEVLVPLIVTWNGTLKSKKPIKIWTTKLILKGTFKNVLPVARIFTRICDSRLQKRATGRKLLAPPPPPSPEFLGGCPPPTDQTLKTLLGPGKIPSEVSGSKDHFFLHFNAFKVVMALKSYIYGLRSYANPKPSIISHREESHTQLSL